ncbi:CCA tRNA nucleotidyltransferase [Spirochaetota bacterium]
MERIKININLSKKDEAAVNSIVKRFHASGFECYLIGGSVRDLILGSNIYDYDFATNAKPDEVMGLFKKVIPTGLKHGTVSILINGKTYEVTTYRADGKYIDGRRPETVSFSKTLEEDVKRRDFTINGLAYDISNGEVIDYVDGMNDLEQKIIRTIGDPMERFSEDGLRSFRACRFASKLYFNIEDNTFDAISRTLDIVKLVSIERVRDELMKLLETDKPSVGFELMRDTKLLDLFLPELAQCYEVSQNKYHTFDIYYHNLYSCDAASKARPLIRLSALLHDLGKVLARQVGKDGDYTFYNHEVVGAKLTRKIMKRLKFSNDEISRVNNLVLNHMFHYTDEWTDGAVRRFMRKVGLENLNDLFTLRLADRKGNGSREGMPKPILKLQARIQKIIDEENAISVRDLNIDGNIIIAAFDLKEGPVIGKVLNELLEIVLDDPEFNKRESLLSAAGEIVESLKAEKK